MAKQMHGHMTIAYALTLMLAAASLAACSSSRASSSPSRSSATHTIRIGTSGPTSGPDASLGTIQDATIAYFYNLNAHGGINGYRFQMYRGNDQFNPALTPSVVRTLVTSDHVNLLCGATGADQLVTVTGYLASTGVPDVAPAVGSAALFRSAPSTEYMVQPPFEWQAASLVDYAVSTLHLTKIAVVYTKDSIGYPALEGVKYEAAKVHARVVAAESFQTNTTSMAAQAAAVKASGANFVIFWHIAPLAALFVNAAQSIGYHPTYGMPAFGVTPTLTSLTHAALNGRVYAVSWNPLLTSASLSNYRAAVKKYYPNHNPATDPNLISGWASGEACAEAIRLATAGGHAFTESRLIKALNEIHNYSTNAFTGLTWTRTSHLGAKDVMIFKVTSNGTFKQLTHFHQAITTAPLTGIDG